MALERVLITIPMVSANPDDVATNTLHFDVLEQANARNSLITEIETFYLNMNTVYSDLVATTGWKMEFYKLSDPQPRRPVATEFFSVSPVGSDTLPTEVACVLSFQAAPVSGLPQSRRRNRIYIGPLASAAVDADGRVTAAVRTVISNAGRDLLAASDASTEWTWATYSPTDGAGADVDNGWVDNAFDTQRRRGLERTTRTLFS